MASSKRATAANFADQVERILTEYGEDITRDLDEVTKKVAQQGAKKIRAAAKSAVGGSGKYAAGWGVTMENTRTGPTAVIHHKTLPGLPHLLEHGHVSKVHGRRVGYVSGREHIAPAEQEIIEIYEKEVISKL